MDQAAWAARIRAQMDYERQREAPPEGFPALPPIPTGRYTDPAFYALESQRLWKKAWLMVGRDEDFEGPGSYRTFQRTGSPLLLVRGNDGVLRGFFNTCQHRGAPVVRESVRHGQAPALPVPQLDLRPRRHAAPGAGPP